MAENRRGTAPAGGLGARVAAWLLHAVGDPPLRVALWNGDEIGPEEAVGTVRLRDRGALWRLARDPALEAGDLYSEGRIELEGDLVALLRAAYQADLEQGPWRRWLWGMPRNDVRRARANARHHYDVGNEFYSLWLDERMVYTCAYFSHRGDTLEEAQRAKLEHVCRKLDLRPGERVIEVGSGWGALALHMARCHGVTVRAFNVSSEQVAWAREQAEKQGLADRVEFIEDDYRNLTGRCEKLVSVGMLEHVGPRQYPELGAVIDRALEPHGLALLHSIGRSRPAPLQRWIAQRIFPNAHPPTL
ncbi:MAG: SAM-dependent methyltransferase, partial [Myxococcota bacterium]